jgi:hypothetical protein
MRIQTEFPGATITNRTSHRKKSHGKDDEKLIQKQNGGGNEPDTTPVTQDTPIEIDQNGAAPGSFSEMLSWLITSGEFLPPISQEETGGGEKGNDAATKEKPKDQKKGKQGPTRDELVTRARQLAQARLGGDPAATSTIFTAITYQELLDQITAHLDGIQNSTPEDNTDITDVRSWWYCGPTAMIHNFLWFEPLKYVETAIDLYLTGEAKPGKGRLKVTKSMKEIKVNRGEASDKDDTGSANFLDWLLIEALRSAENDWFAPKEIDNRAESWQTGTLPWEIDDMARRLGLKPHGGNAYVSTNLRKIEKELEKGNLVVVLDNGLFYSGSKQDSGVPVFKYSGIHYLTIHAIEIDRENKMVKASYWEHGEQTPKEVSFKVFKQAIKAQYSIGKKKGK